MKQPRLSKTHPLNKPNFHWCQGSKIPTIVNGTINSSADIKTNKKSSNRPYTHDQKSIKPSNNEKIIGDSHLKGSATRLRQYLNTKFEICSVKTGARANQIVLSLENELESLGKSDVLVVAGGANDIDVTNVKVNDILAPVIHLVQKYANTNVIIVNIPQRRDLENVEKVDKAKADNTISIIQTYSTKLKTILRGFKNASLVEMSTSRNHFTKHGLHLNKFGKEMIAKQIATQINQIIEIATKSESAICLQ